MARLKNKVPGYSRGFARGVRSIAAARAAGVERGSGPGALRKQIAAGITARTGKSGPRVMRRAARQAHAVRETRRASR